MKLGEKIQIVLLATILVFVVVRWLHPGSVEYKSSLLEDCRRPVKALNKHAGDGWELVDNPGGLVCRVLLKKVTWP